MAIAHKDILETIERLKAIRGMENLRPGKAQDYAPLSIGFNPPDTGVFDATIKRTGQQSQRASEFANIRTQNEVNFRQMMEAQERLVRAQAAVKKAEKLQKQRLQAEIEQQMQLRYNPTKALRGKTNIPPEQWMRGPNGKIDRGRIQGSGKGPWRDPTPLNLKAGLRTVGTPYGKITVNASAADNFVNFLRALNRTGYKVTSIGSYANRNIAGTNTRSLHSYGLAVDVNPSQNPVAYGKVITNLPKGIGRLASKYGLAWGGAWNGAKKDPMHFSIPAYGTK